MSNLLSIMNTHHTPHGKQLMKEMEGGNPLLSQEDLLNEDDCQYSLLNLCALNYQRSFQVKLLNHSMRDGCNSS